MSLRRAAGVTEKRTVILGMGVTGRSCVSHLQGDQLVVLDTRDDPSLVTALPPHPALTAMTGVKSFDFRASDRVIASPGIAMDHALLDQARRAGADIASDIDLFFEQASAPVFVVTGTNGKSTVTALAGELLAAAGYRVAVGGNLGEAALGLLSASIEYYVLELSSFQLERLRSWPFAGGVVLNVTEDHIDRHGSIEAYATVKRRVFDRAAVVAFNRADPLTRPRGCTHGRASSFGLDAPQAGCWGIRGHEGRNWFVRGDELRLPVSDLSLSGLHNQENFLAACALLDDLRLPDEALRKVAREFTALPHRCEFVREIGGVRFYNDSKATNVGATLAAVNGLVPLLGESGRIVLLAGGDGKGADFTPLRTLLPALRGVVLYGRDAKLIDAAMRSEDTAPLTRHAADFATAVRMASDMAKAGDCVLLAPACASLDMFANYGERGRTFVALVGELAA